MRSDKGSRQLTVGLEVRVGLGIAVLGMGRHVLREIRGRCQSDRVWILKDQILGAVAGLGKPAASALPPRRAYPSSPLVYQRVVVPLQ
jgi:hypothetical protein